MEWIYSDSNETKKALAILRRFTYIGEHLEEQQNLFETAYHHIKSINPRIEDRTLFLWAWLCVNTRTLYTQLDRNPLNNLSMAPVIDFLNHTPDQTIANPMTYSALSGMSITSAHQLPAGSQVYITYGSHPNHKLLLEYGFVLPDNPHDYIQIELPLDAAQKSFLDSIGYLGEYTISKDEGPSFRTKVGIIVLSGERQDLIKKLVNGIISEDRFETKVTKLLDKLLRDEIIKWTSAIEPITNTTNEQLNCVKTLLQGWITIATAQLIY